MSALCPLAFLFPPPWPCQMLLHTIPTLFVSGGSSNCWLLGQNVPSPHVTPLTGIAPVFAREGSQTHKFVEFIIFFFLAAQVILFWCGTVCAAELRCFSVVHLCFHVTSIFWPLDTYTVKSAGRYSWFPFSKLSHFCSSHNSQTMITP